MHLRHLIGLLSALAVVIVAIHAPAARGEPAAAPLSPDLVARVHWLGKQQLGLEAGAYDLMRIWGLPESSRVETQTLNKLASAPWRLMAGEAAAAQAPSSLLRPLLDDIVWNESWFEMRKTDQGDEIAFAIRLDERRAGLWRTNLVAVLASLTGVQTMQVEGAGWSLVRTNPPGLCELRRVGGWTVVGLAGGTNALLANLIARVSTEPKIVAGMDSHDWLQADLNLSRLEIPFLQAMAPSGGLPKISVTITGDGADVLTSGELDFPQPLSIPLETWRVPVSRIHDPLTSFTAIRGLGPWLSALNNRDDLHLSSLPDQACWWTLDGVPLQICLAIPTVDASNQMVSAAALLQDRFGPWLAEHDRGSLEYDPVKEAIGWTGLRAMLPHLFPRQIDGQDFLAGGLLANTLSGTNTQAGVYDCPSLGELLTNVLAQPNLVYYDWELTGARVDADLSLGRILQEILGRAQVPLNSACLNWLKDVKARLAGSTTSVVSAGPAKFYFSRKATLGLTGAELQLLADWLESPQFPRGFYTTLTPLPASSQGSSPGAADQFPLDK